MNGHRKDQIGFSAWAVLVCVALGWLAVLASGIYLLFAP